MRYCCNTKDCGFPMCDCVEIMGGKVDMPLDTVALVDKLRAEAYWCDASMENSDFPFAVRTAFKLLAELHRKVAEKLCSQAARLQSLEQELERARKDAERYRWLKPRFRSGGSITDGPLNARRVRYTFNAVDPFLTEHKDIDAAIDTARRTSGDERG